MPYSARPVTAIAHCVIAGEPERSRSERGGSGSAKTNAPTATAGPGSDRIGSAKFLDERAATRQRSGSNANFWRRLVQLRVRSWCR